MSDAFDQFGALALGKIVQIRADALNRLVTVGVEQPSCRLGQQVTDVDLPNRSAKVTKQHVGSI
ncbi:hypothetical protein [Streptomyces sp. NPDC056672]|uniref:hypothetical protein n=1 Tax=Streptomyces sp. NPDC056672 TaxID=3345906 RepID=UPI0036A8299E